MHLAHFEPVPFKIMGHGIFPGLVFQLERANRELHMTRLEEAKRRLAKRFKPTSVEDQAGSSGSRPPSSKESLVRGAHSSVGTAVTAVSGATGMTGATGAHKTGTGTPSVADAAPRRRRTPPLVPQFLGS